MSLSNAKSTIEFAIMNGLSERANITGVTCERANIIIEDIIKSLFSDSTVWAITKYLEEVQDEKD